MKGFLRKNLTYFSDTKFNILYIWLNEILTIDFSVIKNVFQKYTYIKIAIQGTRNINNLYLLEIVSAHNPHIFLSRNTVRNT